MKMSNVLDQEPRPTINPYLAAAGLAGRRLLWDLHPYAWVSRRRIRQWKDRHAGQKAVILCNGPSLNQVDFDSLHRREIFTFGLNKINLLFTRTRYRPSVIVAVNPHVIAQNAAFYNETDIPLFIDAHGRKWVRLRDTVCFLHSATVYRKFARDCSCSISQGATVTYVALQLAFHMGFATVALVGCDHSFASQGPANQTVVAGQEDRNHFDRAYFAHGQSWQLPDIASSELHYELARDTFACYGRKVVNCTEGGRLEIFERQKLSEFLQQ
jgi:hypothetical protein